MNKNNFIIITTLLICCRIDVFDFEYQRQYQMYSQKLSINAISNLHVKKNKNVWGKAKKMSKQIVIAIIDTGVDLSHKQIQPHLWSNNNEIPNGKDDDQNGFVDDIHGWNFADNSLDLNDTHGHGTHIAGIISSSLNNNTEIKFMILKYFNQGQTSNQTVDSLIQSIKYANDMGADIINYSGGGSAPNEYERAIVEESFRKGVLFVAAAGNESRNSDVFGFYPADYDIDGVVSVSAIDDSGKILDSSNYGKKSVDIAALGHDVISALPGNRYGKMTGTSQATAFVSALASLLLYENPDWLRQPLIVKKYLTQTGDKKSDLQEKVSSGARLNNRRAIAMKDSDLSVSNLIIEEATDNLEKYYILNP